MTINTALTADELHRERRCRLWADCPCDHVDCHDGWLIDEVPEPRRGQPDRTVVARCPTCADTVQMRDEIEQTKRKGRRR